jgi:hypothetical protein
MFLWNVSWRSMVHITVSNRESHPHIRPIQKVVPQHPNTDKMSTTFLGKKTDLTDWCVSTCMTHLAIISFLSRLWKCRHRQIFFLNFRVSATIQTYSTASRAFSLVEERSGKILWPLVVCAPFSSSVLYSEPPLQHKTSYMGFVVLMAITMVRIQGKGNQCSGPQSCPPSTNT